MITSLPFWFVLAVGASLYWLAPRVRDWTLLVSSAAFVAWVDRESFVAAAVLGVFAFAVAQRAAVWPKWIVGVAVVFVLSFLAFHKYAPPIAAAIFGSKTWLAGGRRGASGIAVVVPLGASYFTFRLVHYIVDARRGQLPRHDLKTFLGYVFFLPMFAAGPIERFDDYVAARSPVLTREHVAEGGSRILYGMVKKLVLVDILLAKQRATIPTRLGDAIPFLRPPCSVDALLAHSDTVSPLFAWQFVVHRFTVWYLDFSAYSDIAIGAALFFGIRLVENFDWPMLAPTPTAFWKRYHASLSAFCQRYVYFPVLGRARNPYVAVYASMTVMGLWHGGSLNYLFWGLYQATVLSIYLTWVRVKRWRRWKLDSTTLLVVGTVATVLLACASSVFASTNDRGLLAAFRLLGTLVGLHG